MAFNPDKCLKFKALANNCTISLGTSRLDSSHYQFSKDGTTWQNDSITLNNGETCYVKGTNYPSSGSGQRTFSISQPAEIISGNIMSLVDGGAGAQTEITKEGAFFSLFLNCTNLKAIPSSILSASKLTTNCYARLFQNTGISSIPDKLLYAASTLAGVCYCYMFNGCANLTTIPEDVFVPDCILEAYCYQAMFSGTGITELPVNLLQTSNLAQGCYAAMFSGTKIKSVPKGFLPTVELVAGCYDTMFAGCSELEEIYVPFKEWSPASATSKWVNGVASTGTFYCLDELPKTKGISNIPTGWTVKSVPPAKYTFMPAEISKKKTT